MAGLKDPLSDNTMPKYLYSLVASSGDELNVKWDSNYEDSVGNLPGRSFASNCNTDTLNIGPSPNLGPT